MKQKQTGVPTRNKATSTITVEPLNKPSLGIDVDYYQAIIDDPEVSEERKRELIEIIGSIVVSFIDLGFGVHPIQLAQQERQNILITQEKEIEKKGENSHATI